MTVEFTAYSLLNNYANSTEIKGYVDNYDYYIFPVVNPDGECRPPSFLNHNNGCNRLRVHADHGKTLAEEPHAGFDQLLCWH
jgi:murein tripeptide amidase MpaA